MYVKCAKTGLTSILTLPAIAVACRETDVRNVRALIVGPSETPYEFGFFEVGTQQSVF